MVFTGVSFKYPLQKLYTTLLATGKNIWSEIDMDKEYFYLQNEFHNMVINRFGYFSKSDKILYVINYVAFSNNNISKDLFKSFISSSIVKK